MTLSTSPASMVLSTSLATWHHLHGSVHVTSDMDVAQSYQLPAWPIPHGQSLTICDENGEDFHFITGGKWMYDKSFFVVDKITSMMQNPGLSLCNKCDALFSEPKFITKRFFMTNFASTMTKVVRLVCVNIPTSEGSIKSWWINGIVP